MLLNFKQGAIDNSNTVFLVIINNSFNNFIEFLTEIYAPVCSLNPDTLFPRLRISAVSHSTFDINMCSIMPFLCISIIDATIYVGIITKLSYNS